MFKRLGISLAHSLRASLTAILVAAAAGHAQDAPVDLAGVWVAEHRFGRLLEGPVTVRRINDDQWLAELHGETTSVVATANGDWRFEYPGHGYFSGWRDDATGDVVGHWVQRPATVTFYPLASPVRLREVDDGIYAGRIEPFAQDISLNISLVPLDGEAGVYRTFLRNPEQNIGRFFRIERAHVDGSNITFDDVDGQTLATAKLGDDGNSFDMVYPRFGMPMTFARRARDEAPGFYPRRAPAPAAALMRPVPLDDGWPTIALADSDLDPGPLLALVNELAAFEPTGMRQPYIHALLIAQRGTLVVEEYFHGYHRERTHDSRSAGKTLASALLGIALRRGDIKSVDAPVYPFYGGVDAHGNPDPRKEAMTLRHLVTMSSGFDCDDNNNDNPGNEDIMQNQDTQPDWYRYALDLPMVRQPGASAVYCTAAINLLGGAIRQASGVPLLQFFRQRFAAPLGIDDYYANLSPTNVLYLGGGIRLRPRDFLKLGQVYLDDGVWQGRRIVSAAWVRESLAAQASINEPDDYGFAWWRRTYTVGDRRIETFYASGNGGQMLFIVPEYELAVTINAGNYGEGRTRNTFRDRFMAEFILPAALR